MVKIFREWFPPHVSGVYCFYNKLTKRKYVGSSVDVYNRYKRHVRDLKRGQHHSPHLQRSWNKYGPEYFEFFVLERCDATDLLQREQYWLDEISTKYNSSPTAGTRTGIRNTLVTNERISAAIRAKWADPVFRAAAKAGMKGARKRPRHGKH